MIGNRNRSSCPVPVRRAVDGFAAAILLITFIMPAHAQSGAGLPVSVGADASTLGLGLQASVLVSPNGALRLGGNSYDYNKNGTSGSLNYNGKIKLRNYTVAADLYPSKKGNFHVSVGFLDDQNKVDGTAVGTAGSTYTINGTAYPASAIGTLSMHIHYNSFAPYLGIGWGKPVSKGGLEFTADLGALFQGGSTATLTPSNSLASILASLPVNLQGSYQSDVAAQEAKLKHDADELSVYPVASLGLAWSF